MDIRFCAFHTTSLKAEDPANLGRANLTHRTYEKILGSLISISKTCETKVEADMTVVCVRAFVYEKCNPQRYRFFCHFVSNLQGLYEYISFFTVRQKGLLTHKEITSTTVEVINSLQKRAKNGGWSFDGRTHMYEMLNITSEKNVHRQGTRKINQHKRATYIDK